MSIDLHIHSEASDGTQTALEIAREAKAKGLRAVSITDHDSIRRVQDLLIAGRRLDLEVIPGVEITIKDEPERNLREIHLLGYGLDLTESFTDTMLRLEYAKIDWLRDQVEALKSLGRIGMEEVLADHATRAVIRRPHLWKTFHRLNLNLPKGMFFKETNAGGTCYVRKPFELSLKDAIEAVKQANGIPVLAHPCDYFESMNETKDLLGTALDAGIMGIEVEYPYPKGRFRRSQEESKNLIGFIDGFAGKHKLIKTGGSDCHGANKDIAIGEIEVPEEYLRIFQ